jgi:lysophospholipase L1-like esterase
MKHALLFAAVLAACSAMAQPAPVRIILVGDSTVAVGNGWGPGFCALVPQVACINMAKNGRSSASYRAEGSWDEVTKELAKGGFDATYFLIQFGHNDQPGKPGRSTDLVTEFPANMRRYVQEVKAAGARPVLITPLTRRTFQDGQVINTLRDWAESTIKVAAEEHVPMLDLNAESLAAVQKMGPDEADTLAVVPRPPAGQKDPKFDYTHLGPKGSAYFGKMVAGELTAAVPDLKPYVTQ